MQRRPSNPDLHAVQSPEQTMVSFMQKRPSNPDLHSVQNTKQPIVSIMQKRRPGLWLTCCVKLKQFHCKHQAKKASHTLTYILFKIQTIPLSASCGKGLLNPDLHAIQNPKQPIVSIMQKRPPGPWLTYCWKPQTITLSASCRKGLQEPDLHPVQNAQQPIVSIMQRRPPGPWLTSCLKPRPFCCQHDAGNAFWSLIYLLFKTQSSPLSASCRKGLLHPNLQTVQNPE